MTCGEHDWRTLVRVLTYHQRTEDTGCACGWGEWGGSFAEHVAEVYRQALGFEGTR